MAHCLQKYKHLCSSHFGSSLRVRGGSFCIYMRTMGAPPERTALARFFSTQTIGQATSVARSLRSLACGADAPLAVSIGGLRVGDMLQGEWPQGKARRGCSLASLARLRRLRAARGVHRGAAHRGTLARYARSDAALPRRILAQMGGCASFLSPDSGQCAGLNLALNKRDDRARLSDRGAP